MLPEKYRLRLPTENWCFSTNFEFLTAAIPPILIIFSYSWFQLGCWLTIFRYEPRSLLLLSKNSAREGSCRTCMCTNKYLTNVDMTFFSIARLKGVLCWRCWWWLYCSTDSRIRTHWHMHIRIKKITNNDVQLLLLLLLCILLFMLHTHVGIFKMRSASFDIINKQHLLNT